MFVLSSRVPVVRSSMKIRAAAAATLQGCNAMADDRSIELNSKFSGGDGDGDGSKQVVAICTVEILESCMCII